MNEKEIKDNKTRGEDIGILTEKKREGGETEREIEWERLEEAGHRKKGR